MSDIELSAGTLTYTQEADSCSHLAFQQLTVEIRDAGGGPYLVISTPEWALDSPEDIMAVLTNALTALERSILISRGRMSVAPRTAEDTHS
jgi:hypothetical protein